MFERVAPSEEQRDAEAREGRSPDQIAALRLAAILVLIDACLSIAVAITFGSAGQTPFMAIAIRLVMAYYLYKLRPRAEALALGLTILGGILTLLGLGLGLGAGRLSAWSLIDAIPPLGGVGALLLLLLGDPPREKRIAAIVIFGVLVIAPSLALIVLRLTGVLGAPPVPAG